VIGVDRLRVITAARVAALLLAVLAAAIPLAGTAAAQEPEPSSSARTAWGFDRSDLAPHPAVRFGVLPNGMRYALMRNAVPAGAMSVRLHLAGGAMLEGEREQGFMHLIEHMIFHGSANIPEGALPLMLAQRGLRRWTDFDAYTSHDETVYRLDLAQADAGARETALTLMREIAGNLAFTRRGVAGAKRRVREEIAARDAVQDRIATAQNAFFLPGTRLARGPVAGTSASVRRASAAALRRIYALHYVPSRATLVLVGDFDPTAAEAEIVARLSGWRVAPTPHTPPQPVSTDRRQGIRTRLFVDPAAPTMVTIATVAPLAATEDAAGRRDWHFLEHLAVEMLNRRLARLAAGPDPPFARAGAAAYDHFSTARIARIEAEAADRNWRRALSHTAFELRRALEDGFSPAELAEQLAASRRGLARDAAPRTSSALADAIVETAGRSIVFTATAGPAASEAYLARVRLADVNAAFSRAWAAPGRLIFLSHNRRIPNADAEIAAGWARAVAARVAAPEESEPAGTP
jgi:zinc protease